ncbi:MAG: hypothetical protein AAF430_23345 [Myxococcota bacterium]
MLQSRKIVLLEANEIPFRIFDRYVANHDASALARHLPACRQYMTFAIDSGHLSPWVTWPTLHRGVSNDEHKIRAFGEDLTEANEKFPPIWELLNRGGVKTGVFGPLHSWPLPERPERFDFFVPDTFANTPECYPDELTSFQRFNLAMARKSPRNVSSEVDWKSAVQFMVRAPALGLRPKTVMELASQLIQERTLPWKRIRRRTFQPVLAFDLFMKQLERHRPAFSNFFTNHVASSMHRFWAAIFPDEYDALELGEEWQEQYGGEIDFCMAWTNDFFERLTSFADQNPEYLILVASSMGQAAASGKRIATQLYLRKPERLLAKAGVGEGEWERRPSMEPAVSLYVAEHRCDEFRSFLNRMEIRGEAVYFDEKDGGFFDLHFGQTNLQADEAFASVDGAPVPFAELGLESVELEDEAGSTAYHVPEGTLFIYDPQNRERRAQPRPRLDTIEIAPALLTHFGLDVPPYMRKPSSFRIVEAR